MKEIKDDNQYQGKPFALLLPAYTASKSYWREFVTDLESKSNYSLGSNDGGISSTYSGSAVLYVLPPDSYEYRHPEGTGKDAPPFYSAWFIGGFKSPHTAAVNNKSPHTEAVNNECTSSQQRRSVSTTNITDR